jgi:hypothetical protein
MANMLITEKQMKMLSKKLISEALGVPDYVLDAAEILYDKVKEHIQSINDVQEEYEFDGSVDFVLGGKKKVKIDSYNLTVNIEEFDGYEGVLDIMSMGVAGRFEFNRDKYMKENEMLSLLELTITYAVGEGWDPKDLIVVLEKDKEEHIASLAHELKHKYDKQAKQFSLIGDDAEYQATQRKGNFGIKVIDNVFFRYMYYISGIENLVRPTEIASSMKSKNITKSKFMDFLRENRVYNELVEIRKFTFDDFITRLKEEEDRMDALLDHIDEDPSNMTIDEKINRVLEVVYIDLVNNRMEMFVKMTEHHMDTMIKFGAQLGLLPPNLQGRVEELKKTDEIRQKFLNYTIKFKNNPTKFFENEIENFNFVSNKILKKISKLYAMAKDDEQVTESIINWDLHQKLMEKRYGKRKIETEIKDWKIK